MSCAIGTDGAVTQTADSHFAKAANDGGTGYRVNDSVCWASPITRHVAWCTTFLWSEGEVGNTAFVYSSLLRS
jgi:hypothetical protein